MDSIIKQKVQGRSVLEGAGVKIYRLIGTPELDTVDPFVLLDEFKSTNPDDYIAGFPMHPHRGIETITYMIQGSFRHTDSRGGGGVLTDGSVQWMTAGKGIQHSEMPERTHGQLWGYQLWLSLPAKDKMIEPRYQHLTPDDIPAVEEGGLLVKVISGEYGGKTGPAANHVPTQYLDVTVTKGSKFQDVPEDGKNRFIYAHTGSIRIVADDDVEIVHQKELVTLGNGAAVEVSGVSDHAGFLYLAAFPNNEPIVKGGPFVMNSRDEIRQAYLDYQRGELF